MRDWRQTSLRKLNAADTTAALAAKADAATTTAALAAKQNTVVDDGLDIRHVRFLQDSLDSKQALLGDVPGTGISLRYGTKLRQVYGHGGIAVTHSLNQQDINDPSNFQVRISAAALQADLAQGLASKQPLITAQAPLSQDMVSGLVDDLSTASTSAAIADGSLTTAKTNGLQEALDTRMTISAVNNSLNYKQDKMSTSYPLPQSHVQGLEAALSGKIDTLSDAPGSGSSLVASGSTLRKLVGQDGIDVATNVTIAPDGNISSEILISGRTLIDSIAHLTAAVANKQNAISTISPLPIDYVFG